MIPKLRKSTILRGFLNAVNVSAVAIMLAVLLIMGKDTLSNWPNIIIALLSFAFVFGPKKLNTIWVIVISALLGYLLSLIRS